MTPKEQLLLEIEQAPDMVIEMVLDWLQSLKRLFQSPEKQTDPWSSTTGTQSFKDIEHQNVNSLTTQSTDFPYFLQVLAEIHAETPDAEWDKIPSDLSINFDHYLYGGETIKK